MGTVTYSFDIVPFTSNCERYCVKPTSYNLSTHVFSLTSVSSPTLRNMTMTGWIRCCWFFQCGWLLDTAYFLSFCDVLSIPFKPDAWYPFCISYPLVLIPLFVSTSLSFAFLLPRDSTVRACLLRSFYRPQVLSPTWPRELVTNDNLSSSPSLRNNWVRGHSCRVMILWV